MQIVSLRYRCIKTIEFDITSRGAQHIVVPLCALKYIVTRFDFKQDVYEKFFLLSKYVLFYKIFIGLRKMVFF